MTTVGANGSVIALIGDGTANFVPDANSPYPESAPGVQYVAIGDFDGKGKSGSAWSRLAFWRSDTVKKDEQFRISVADVDKGSEVRVQNSEGATAKSPTAGRIQEPALRV